MNLPESPLIGSLGLTRLGPDSPHNFWALGEEFLKAAKIITDKHPNEWNFPTYFLLCHALELYLKSFLRSKEVSVEDLKNPTKFGHDLQCGFNLARSKGSALIFTDELEQCVKDVSPTYKNRDFQYMHTGQWTLPVLPHLLSLVEILSGKLKC